MLLIFVLMVSCAEEGDVKPEEIKEWTSFKKTSGLAGNNVKDFFEDSHGVMWIGTTEGVSAYNGNKFTTYTTGSTQGGLSSNVVYSIIETSAGEFWFGTKNGLSILSKTKTWSNLPTIGGFTYEVYSLWEDKKKIVWIGTDQLGVLYFDGKNLFQIFDSGCGACNTINALYSDKEDNLWIATDGGLKMLPKSDPKNAVKYYTRSNGLSGNVITSLAEDHWGNLWIGTYDGKTLTRYSNGKFTQQAIENLFTDNWITGLAADDEGTLWIGTAIMGLYKFDGAFMRKQVKTIPDSFMGPVTTDKKGNVWIGTYQQGVILHKPTY